MNLCQLFQKLEQAKEQIEELHYREILCFSKNPQHDQFTKLERKLKEAIGSLDVFLSESSQFLTQLLKICSGIKVNEDRQANEVKKQQKTAQWMSEIQFWIDFSINQSILSRIDYVTDNPEIKKQLPQLIRFPQLMSQLFKRQKEEIQLCKLSQYLSQLQKSYNLNLCPSSPTLSNVTDRFSNLLSVISEQDDLRNQQNNLIPLPNHINFYNKVLTVLQYIYQSNDGLLEEQLRTIPNNQVSSIAYRILHQIRQRNTNIDILYGSLFQLFGKGKQMLCNFTRTVKSFPMDKKIKECLRLVSFAQQRKMPINILTFNQTEQEDKQDYCSQKRQDEAFQVSQTKQRLQMLLFEKEEELYCQSQTILELSEQVKMINQRYEELKMNVCQINKQNMRYQIQIDLSKSNIKNIEGINQKTTQKREQLDSQTSQQQINTQELQRTHPQVVCDKQQHMPYRKNAIDILKRYEMQISKIQSTLVGHLRERQQNLRKRQNLCIKSQLINPGNNLSSIKDVRTEKQVDINFQNGMVQELVNFKTDIALPRPRSHKLMMKHTKSLFDNFIPEFNNFANSDKPQEQLEQNCPQNSQKAMILKDKTLKKYEFAIHKFKSEKKKYQSKILELEEKNCKQELQIIELKQQIASLKKLSNQQILLEEQNSLQQELDESNSDQDIMSPMSQKKIKLKIKEESINYRIEQIIKHVMHLNQFKSEFAQKSNDFQTKSKAAEVKSFLISPPRSQMINFDV